MQEYPLVSVIVPNYNHARFLDQRLQSILNQTYRNIEVVILDDCSTDNSLEVIEKYRADARIVDVIVNEKNSGSTFLQWDKGIHLAKGELVWIAESDDYCELNMLEELVKAYYKKRGTALAYSTSEYVGESGEKLFYSSPFDKNKYCKSTCYIRRYLSLGCQVGNASSAVFSREAGLRVTKDYITIYAAGDYLFWVEIACQGNVAIVNKNLNKFRRHSGTVTDKNTLDGSNLRAEMDILCRMKGLVHFSILRNKLAHAYRIYEIHHIRFETPKIKNELLDMWGEKRNYDKVGRFMVRVANSLRKRYSFYI